MGHKRLGILPKTKAWRLIVSEMTDFAIGNSDAEKIAKETLSQVRDRFNNLENDPSIKASLEFLVKFGYAFKTDDPIKYLKENNILDGDELTTLKLARAVNGYKQNEIDSNEYKTFARQAAVDAITNWYKNNIEKSQPLFSKENDNKSIFSKAGDGRGFCELARLFFSKFTTRYLKYFLEREAASAIRNVKLRDRFNENLEKHLSDISEHAFETSKIAESYAAGWFNSQTKESFPDDATINGFVSYGFEKMRSELLVEEQK